MTAEDSFISDGAFPLATETETYARQTLLHRSENGFCEVWRAQRQGRFVVLKCLKKAYRTSPPHIQFLRNEFQTGYGLSHPNIAQARLLLMNKINKARMERQGDTLSE